MNDLGGLLASEEFRGSIQDDGMGAVCLSALEKLNDVMFEDDPQTVKEGIDTARAELTYMQSLVGDLPAYKKLESFPALVRIRNRLQLPERDTGKEFSMSIRGVILYGGPKINGYKFLFRKVVYAQEARKNPDLENAKVDKNALYKRAEELEEQTIPFGNVLEELTAEEAYQILDANDGGAKKGLKSEHDGIDEGIIKKNMNQMQRMPGYQDFEADPRTAELLHDGDFRQLAVQYSDHVKAAHEKQVVDDVLQQWEVLRAPEAEPGPEQQIP